MISIYTDSTVIDQEWLPKLKFSDDITIYHNFKEYQQSQTQFKIAFVGQRLHQTHDFDSKFQNNFEDKINELSAISKLVFIFEGELHLSHWSTWLKCHASNVFWLQPGAVNTHDAINNQIIHWGDWFKTTTNLYKALPEIVAQLRPYEAKSKYFDALLGSPKPHRSFISQAINENNLNDKCIMTYGGQWDDNKFFAKDYYIYEPGTEVFDAEPGTMGLETYRGFRAKYHDQLCSLGHIIPIEVFNNTAYSIVAETEYDNSLSFFTEKTAKPMIARRLFIVFSGYKFLDNLKKIGFKTFDGIIDESYDFIQHTQQRYNAAVEQIKYLCNQDQTIILEKIKPIVEHNYDLIMNTDWTEYSVRHIQFTIDNYQP